MLPLQVKLLSDDLRADEIDPRYYLEQYAVDCTCELCRETLLPYAVYDVEKNVQVGYAHRVKRVWMRAIFKRDGYKLKHWRWWKICETCRLKLSGEDDLYGFAKFVFPVIRSVNETALVEQLVQVQPMTQPAAQVFYMDFVHDGVRVPGPREEMRELARMERRRVPNDAADALLGALVAARQVRGQRANGIVLDDANWRLDDNPGDADV